MNTGPSPTAYRRIVESGRLGVLQRDVYELLVKLEPHTAGELTATLRKMRPTDSVVIPSYHKRLSELERYGLARRVGVRVCRVTGHPATVWTATDATEIREGRRLARPKRPSPEAIEHAASILRGFYLTKPEVGPVADWLESFGPKQRRLPLDTTRPAA